ncbi:MAG: hypothetical protein JOZ80_18365 [Acidobacteriaceae bacterium]|nr:hypothetical protein [Acidobacteriaceae bacterium]
MRIGRYVGNTVPLPHTKRLQRRRPSISAIEECRVGKAQVAIHHDLKIGMQLARASSKVEY